MTPAEMLTNDMKTALKAGDKVRLDAVRYLLAKVKNQEIDKPGHAALTEDEFVQLVRKLVKDTKEAMSQFAAGNRQDLVDAEQPKLAIWEAYLPAALTPEQIESLIDETIEQGKAAGENMGVIIKRIMSTAAGQIDGGEVARRVKERMTN